MSWKRPSMLWRAGGLSAAAAVAVGFVGVILGNWVERYWDVIVITPAAWGVWGLVTLGGFFIGFFAAMIGRVIVGTVLGIVLGACLATLGPGGPQAFVIWMLSVCVCVGAVSGAVGGAMGERDRKS